MDSALLTAMLRGATPLIFAAMGGLVCERSGVVNIGLEGLMLTAAFFGALGSLLTGVAWLGLLIGIAASVVLSSLHVLNTQRLGMDHVVSGVAVNAIAFGGTAFLATKILAGELSTKPVPALSQWALIPVALILPFVLLAWLFRTRSGLHVLAVGNAPEKAAAMGVNPVRVRTAAILVSGVFSGFGGAFLSLAYVPGFSEAVTAGRGFIALAALILGRWNPVAAMAAALGFGLFDALQIRMQDVIILGVTPPSEFWSSLPYALTIVALIGFGKRARPPAALGKV
jgi:general nucleoside transport system permease protein